MILPLDYLKCVQRNTTFEECEKINLEQKEKKKVCEPYHIPFFYLRLYMGLPYTCITLETLNWYFFSLRAATAPSPALRIARSTCALTPATNPSPANTPLSSTAPSGSQTRRTGQSTNRRTKTRWVVLRFKLSRDIVEKCSFRSICSPS